MVNIMCTAISITGNYHLFGRTLDVDTEYGQEVTVLPKNSIVEFAHQPTIKEHPAILGMAVKFGEIPLFFDGVNEFGLCAAALNFPQFTVYHSAKKDKVNITSYEFITFVLCSCSSVDDAERLLKNANITLDSFSDDLLLTPLHWIISDRNRSVTVESVADGLKIYDNPIGVLTNAPEFPYHMIRLSDYMKLSPKPPENKINPSIKLKQYSGGMGTLGLPGDFTSNSRFIRAAFVKSNITQTEDKNKSIVQFFHILDCVFVPKGCVQNKKEGGMHTSYSCCIDPTEPAYYFTTYDNRNIIKKVLER